MRFILLTFLAISLNVVLSESAWTASCDEFVSGRETLVQISDELAGEIGRGEPCSPAVIDQVRRRHIAMDAIIKAGDYLVENCGYKLKPEGRKKNVSMLAKMATYKEMCATFDTDKIDQLLDEMN